MGLGDLVKGYAKLGKDVYESNKPAIDSAVKELVAPPVKKKIEKIKDVRVPKVVPPPVIAPVPVKKKIEKIKDVRVPKVVPPPVIAPVSPKFTPFETIDWIKNRWPEIKENIEKGTFIINSDYNLKIKQNKILEDLKTTKDFDYIREDLVNMKFDTDEQRKTFMQPFLSQPGLLEAYIPKPRSSMFPTVRSVVDFTIAHATGEIGVGFKDYMDNQPPANRLIRSITERILNDKPQKTSDIVKEYWRDQYEQSIKSPMGQEAEENLYNYLLNSMPTYANMPKEDTSLAQKKEWIEARMSRDMLKNKTEDWKSAIGFYGRPPSDEEIQEMNKNREEALQKEKEDFIKGKLVGTGGVWRLERSLALLFNPDEAYEILEQKYPEAFKQAEQEYLQEKEKSYLLSVAEAELTQLDIKALGGLRALGKREKDEAWGIQRIAKRLVQAGTFDIIKPDTIIGKAFKTIYVEDGYKKYNGFIVDKEFKTKEGQKSAQIADVAASLVGALAPYSAISGGIKIGIAAIAKTSGVAGKLANGVVKATAKYGVTMEVTAYNILEESADLLIRKATNQEYTFNNFIQGLAVGSFLGGFLIGGQKAYKGYKKLGGIGTRDVGLVDLSGVMEQIEKILSITKNIDDVRDVKMPNGRTVYSMFQEQRMVYKNLPEGIGVFGKKTVPRPGVDTPAPLPKVEEKIDYAKEGWKYDPTGRELKTVMFKQNEISELNKTIDKVNKHIEKTTDTKEIAELIEHRESMIDFQEKIKEDINTLKEYSPEEVAMYEKSIMDEYSKEAAQSDRGRLETNDEYRANITVVNKLFKVLSRRGVKMLLSGGKTTKGFTTKKTFKDTFQELFINGDVDTFNKSLDDLSKRFAGTRYEADFNELASMGKQGGFDSPQAFDEIALPLLNKYGEDGALKYEDQKVPSRAKIDEYFGSKTERGVAKSIKKMKDTTKETKKILKGEEFYYDQLKNKDTLAKANKMIQESEHLAYRKAVDAKTPEDVVAGMVLMKKYQAEGRYDEVSSLLNEISSSATNRGQMNQVFAMFSLLTPEGALRQASKILSGLKDINKKSRITQAKLDNIVDRIAKVFGNKFSKTELKFTRKNVEIEVRAILKDVKMSEKNINKILDSIGNKFSKTELKFTRQNVKIEVRAILKDVVKEFKFLKEYDLSKADMFKFVERTKELHRHPLGSEERAFQTKLLLRDLAELKPKGWVAQTALYQSGSLLLNVVTLGRNIVANELFGMAEELSTLLASGLDRTRVTALQAIGIDAKRSVTFGLKEKKDAFIYALKNIKKNYREVINGVNFAGIDGAISSGHIGATSGIIGRTATKGPLKIVEQALGITLRIPDRFAFDRVFVRDLYRSGRLEAMNNKIPRAERKKFLEKYMENPPEEAIEKATAKGLYNTFQDKTVLSTMLQSIKQALNIDKEWGAGSAVLLFTRTPANIINRSVAYTPAGIVKALAPEGLGKWLKHGYSYDTGEATMAVSRALIGSAVTIMAYKIASAGGIISADDNRRLTGVLREEGKGRDQINAHGIYRWVISGFDDEKMKYQDGDKLISYEQFAPLSLSIAAGVELHKQLESKLANGRTVDPLQLLGALIGSSLDVANIIIEQPVFTGIKRLGYGDPVEGMLSVAEGVPATFIPTFLYQVRKYVDNVPNETYSPSRMQKSLNMVLNRIPFVHDMDLGIFYNPQNKKTIKGMDAELYQNTTNSIFNVFFNPTFITEVKNDPINVEYLDLFKETGETKFMPVNSVKYYKLNNVRYDLSSKDYATAQITQGKLLAQLHTQIINSRFYESLDDSEKVKSLYDAYTDAGKITKGEWLYNSVKDKKIIYNNLSDDSRDNYLLYEVLFKAGLGDIDNKIYGNIEVEKAKIKFKNPEIYNFAKEDPDMGAELLGAYMEEAGLEVTNEGVAPMEKWRKYKQVVLLKSIKDAGNINTLIDTINTRKSTDEKIIDTMEQLVSERKISDKEREYIYISTLKQATLKDLGYFF